MAVSKDVFNAGKKLIKCYFCKIFIEHSIYKVFLTNRLWYTYIFIIRTDVCITDIYQSVSLGAVNPITLLMCLFNQVATILYADYISKIFYGQKSPIANKKYCAEKNQTQNFCFNALKVLHVLYVYFFIFFR